jgi:hypothetical protein
MPISAYESGSTAAAPAGLCHPRARRPPPARASSLAPRPTSRLPRRLVELGAPPRCRGRRHGVRRARRSNRIEVWCFRKFARKGFAPCPIPRRFRPWYPRGTLLSGRHGRRFVADEVSASITPSGPARATAPRMGLSEVCEEVCEEELGGRSPFQERLQVPHDPLRPYPVRQVAGPGVHLQGGVGDRCRAPLLLLAR